jgi:hypothetical protein
MRKMIATALVALAVAGSALAPAGSVALAEMDTQVDQFIVDSQSLTNIEYTRDNEQSAPENTPAPAEDRCGCAAVPEELPVI